MSVGRHPNLVVTTVAIAAVVTAGGIATLGTDIVACTAVALVGMAVVTIGLASGRPATVARVLLWAVLIASLGLKVGRRTADEVATRPLTLENGLAVGVLGAGVVGACVLLAGRVRLLPLSRQERWLGAFAACTVVSGAWSAAPSLTLLRAVVLGASYATIVALARAQEANGADPLRDLATAVHVIIATALVGLVVAPGAALAPIPGATIAIGRLKGAIVSVHPNALAFLAVVGIVCALAGLGLGRAGRRWGVRVGVVGVEVAVLMATRTRSALVLLAMAAVVAVVLHPTMRRRAVVLVPTVLAMAAVVALLAGVEVAGFVARGQTSEQVTGLTGRLDEWGHAVSVALEQPLWGHGYYTGHRFGALAATEGALNTTTDNAWIDVGIDLGLLGVVLLAGFVVAVGRALWRARRRGHGDATTALVLLAVCVGASCINPSMNESTWWMLVLVCLGVTVAPNLEARPASLPLRSHARATRHTTRRRHGQTGLSTTSR